jgi:hypothetical protein
MNRQFLRRLVVVVVIASSSVPTKVAAQDPANPADVLTRGTMGQAVEGLRQRVERDAGDDNARFALAIAQTLRGVERLAASMHRYGLRTDTWAREMPFFRIPVPANPDPEPISYDESRQMLIDWLEDMAAARKTLSEIKRPQDVKLELPIGMMHLDLNGDGTAADDEQLWKLFAALNRGLGRGPEQLDEKRARQFVIALDGGDVHWLHGYCHLLSALPEMSLAYDQSELFHATAHMFFKNVETPHAFLNEGVKVADFGAGVDIVDAIAFVHLLNLPVNEPQRMTAGLEHLRAMLDQSRKSWDLILAETDDDREWIPSPRQSTVLPNTRVTDEMVKTWMTFLDEAQAVLDGKKLIPFWRSRDGRGVNLRRVFTEPTRFDLVLWVQGTAATPYLEEGELTTPQTWRQFQRVFAGDFFTFAVWFN